jgi:two-component system response regulator AtoC
MTAARNMGRILIAEDQQDLRELLAMSLRDRGYAVTEAADGEEALTLLRSEPHELVLSDLRMPRMDGMSLLRETRKLKVTPAFIMITAHGSIPDAVEAMHHGAFDFVEKGCDPEELEMKVAQALGTHAPLGSGASPLEGVVGSTPQMLELADLVDRLCDKSLPVLLRGEAGSGRRHVARALHGLSDRAELPFITYSCAGNPSAAEAEIFGRESVGAEPVRGAIEEAGAGVLLLEDVAALPQSAQYRLYRLLTDRTVERVGGTRGVPVEARVIATALPDIEEACKAERFRKDLYYRLATATIPVPTLRERRDDIPALVRHFAELATAESGRKADFSPRCISLLTQYQWPGNVAELASVISACVSRSVGGFIEEKDLPANLRESITGGGGLAAEIEDHERSRVLEALTKHDWNQTHAAKHLGVSRTSLQYKMQKYSLKKPGSQ